MPGVYASGETRRSGRITRDGAPWLRWALVEIAMHAMKRSDQTCRWARRLAIRKGVTKARVALARRLCDDIVQGLAHGGAGDRLTSSPRAVLD